MPLAEKLGSLNSSNDSEKKRGTSVAHVVSEVSTTRSETSAVSKMSTRSTRSSSPIPIPPKKLPRPASFPTKPKERTSEQKRADAQLERQARLHAFLRRNNLKDVNEPKMPDSTCFIFRRSETFYPLHYAVMEDDADLVRILLIAGADPEIQRSSKRRRPQDLARDLAMENSEKIIEILEMAESAPPAQTLSLRAAKQMMSS
eukprot:symbB.v1.2.035191.t1/scaffold4664.1/size36758/1